MRIMALDLGERHIGVALSDPMGWLATPLTTLKCDSREEELAAIENLVHKHQVGQVVVGYPRSLSGTVGPQAQHVERYTEKLRARLQVPVILWEEQFSTVQAERLIHETGRRVRPRGAGGTQLRGVGRTQRERIDAAAAAVILQSYLDAQTLAKMADDK